MFVAVFVGLCLRVSLCVFVCGYGVHVRVIVVVCEFVFVCVLARVCVCLYVHVCACLFECLCIVVCMVVRMVV